MAISTTANRISYTGNGVTTAFAFPYKFLQEEDLVVVKRTIADGTETVLTLTTNYTTTGEGSDVGGTVTLLVAPSSAYEIVIYNDPDATQEVNLEENDSQPAEVVEGAFDKLTILMQRLKDVITRSVRLSDGFAPDFDTTLPVDLDQAANRVPAVNATGDGWADVADWPSVDDIQDADEIVAAAAASATAAAASASAASTSASSASTSASSAASSAAAAAALLGQATLDVATLPKTLTSTDNGKVFKVDTSGGAGTITLFAATNGFKFSVVDVGGNMETNNLTIARAGSQKIHGVSGNFTCEKNYGAWTFGFDGTDWWVLSDAKGRIAKEFLGVNQNWTAPANVTRIKVTAFTFNQWIWTAAAKGGTVLSDTHTAWLNKDGDLYMAGLNDKGQLGNGDTTSRSSPVAVLGSIAFQKVKCGEKFTVALDWQGNAYAWGINTNGQLGVGDVTARSSPVAVLGGLTFTDIDVGQQHVLAITSGGALYAWGLNTNGGLGVGDVTPRSSPVAVLGGLTFADFSAGTLSSAAVTTGGAGYAWGLNDNGQLGHGNVTPKSSPVAVLGGLTLSKIALGSSASSAHMLMVTTGGAAYACGANANGQLGVGDVTSRSSPVAVLGGITFADVDGATLASMGITSAGIAYGWGNGPRAGLNSGSNFSSPIAVVGGITWSQLALGSVVGTGISTSPYTGYAFGTNADGQLAIGTVVANSSPAAILKPSNLTLPIIMSNVAFITVVPGTTYAVKSLGSAAFGSTIIKSTSYQAQVFLEY